MNLERNYIQRLYESVSDRVDSTVQTALDVVDSVDSIRDQSHVDIPNRSKVSTLNGRSIETRVQPEREGFNPNYRQVISEFKNLHPELVSEIEELEERFGQRFVRKARNITKFIDDSGREITVIH